MDHFICFLLYLFFIPFCSAGVHNTSSEIPDVTTIVAQNNSNSNSEIRRNNNNSVEHELLKSSVNFPTEFLFEYESNPNSSYFPNLTSFQHDFATTYSGINIMDVDERRIISILQNSRSGEENEKGNSSESVVHNVTISSFSPETIFPTTSIDLTTISPDNSKNISELNGDNLTSLRLHENSSFSEQKIKVNSLSR